MAFLDSFNCTSHTPTIITHDMYVCLSPSPWSNITNLTQYLQPPLVLVNISPVWSNKEAGSGVEDFHTKLNNCVLGWRAGQGGIIATSQQHRVVIVIHSATH